MRLLTAKGWNQYWRWSSKLLLEINLQDSLLQFSCTYEIQELNKVLLKKLLNSLSLSKDPQVLFLKLQFPLIHFNFSRIINMMNHYI